VVCGCALLYGLPDLWYTYEKNVYPAILPYLLPTTQESNTQMEEGESKQ
jgi:hypothetical protein